MMICPNCGFQSPPGMRFCGMCGSEIARVCPKCGFSNPLDFRFCGMCGFSLAPIQDQAGLEPVRHTLFESVQQPVRPALEGERRVVTVIVADVTGSTRLLEEIGNEAWVELMNKLLLQLEGEIYRFGGEVDQFRGDGLVAFFGASYAREDDPERAVMAGLEMQAVVKRFAESYPAEAARSIRLRVGINTGEVIVASIGESGQHREDTAMGSAIAVAARLENLAEPGTVLVSESTYHQAEDRFVWIPLGEVQVRGISQPLRVYRPEAPRGTEEFLSDVEVFGTTAPLVGRETEFSRLHACLDRLRAGQGGTILLTGEVGIGKHALVNELRQLTMREQALLDEAGSGQPYILWLSSRTHIYDRDWPYSLWIVLLRNWLSKSGTGEGEDTLQILRRECQRLWGEEFLSYYPYLARILSLPLEEEFQHFVQYLDAEALRFQFTHSIRGWLEALSRQQPLVVCLTDLEWADFGSVDILEACLSLSARESLLWILVFRPCMEQSPICHLIENLEELDPGPVEKVELGPLIPEDVARLIEALIGKDVLPVRLVDQIVRNSEGIPSYVIEMLRSLIERRILVRDGATGEWRLNQTVQTLDFTESMQRLIQARIDRLDDVERDLLQKAAVIGYVFWVNLLRGLVEETIPVRQHLRVLQDAQLIEQRGWERDLGTEFAFKTELIHETVYESLLSSQREALHIQVAQLLEEIVDLEIRTQFHALIAYHYRQGGAKRQELFYTLWAAQKAEELSAPEEAVELYSRVLELLNQIEHETTDAGQIRSIFNQRFEAYSGRIKLYYRLNEPEKAAQDAHALLALAQQMADQPAWKVDALFLQPEVVLADTREMVNAGLDMVGQALEIARSIGDVNRELKALMERTRLLLRIGDLQAFESARRGLELARTLGDVETEVSLLIDISNAYGMENVVESRRYLQQAMALKDRVQNRKILSRLYSALCGELERQGDYVRMLEEYVQKRLEIAREIGDRLEEGMVLMFYGQVQGLYLGDLEPALKKSEEAYIRAEKYSQKLYPLLRLAQLHAQLGNLTRARHYLKKAEPLSQSALYLLGRAGYLLVFIHLLEVSGKQEDFEKVLELVEEIRGLYGKGFLSRQYWMAACCKAAYACLRLAEMTRKPKQKAQTYRTRALEFAQEGYQIYQEYGFVQIIEVYSEEILFRYAQALMANGRMEEGQQMLVQSLQELRRKWELIPADSLYRRTFLKNLRIHREMIAMAPEWFPEEI